jgi:hypothetical protein
VLSRFDHHQNHAREAEQEYVDGDNPRLAGELGVAVERDEEVGGTV